MDDGSSVLCGVFGWFSRRMDRSLIFMVIDDDGDVILLYVRRIATYGKIRVRTHTVVLL